MNNILLEGGPGSGKTFMSRAIAYYIGIKKCSIDEVENQNIIEDLGDIEDFISSNKVEYIQVHPSMSYSDIVYGLDVKAEGTLKLENIEKRIKIICDKASKNTEDYFIILDDIDRTNSGELLGNIFYAMEYRNEILSLTDTIDFVIPDNVSIIMTENVGGSKFSADYALRRRFTYVKRLYSNRKVIEQYYSDSSCIVKTTVLNLYDKITNNIRHNIDKNYEKMCEEYIPGQGMFMVSLKGTDYDVIHRVNLKLKHQIIPYINQLLSSSIVERDIERDIDETRYYLNTGEKTRDSKIISIEKVLIRKTKASFSNYVNEEESKSISLLDAKDYFVNHIIREKCKDLRGVIECLSDVMCSNGILPKDIVIHGVLKNTDLLEIKSLNSERYASFWTEFERAESFKYEQVNEKDRNIFSCGSVGNGSRWNDAFAEKRQYEKRPFVVYRASDVDGNYKDYVYISALRNVNTATQKNVPTKGTAPFKFVVYKMVMTYLKRCELEYHLEYQRGYINNELCSLLNLELRYLDEIYKENIETFCESLLYIQSLWNNKNTEIDINDRKINELTNSFIPFTKGDYEEIFNNPTTKILLKGATDMYELENYGQIMKDIGIHQMIFQGPPGTSKTFRSKKYVLEELSNANGASIATSTLDKDAINNELEKYKLSDTDYNDPLESAKLGTGGWDLVQFHPSYGYEDFVRGIVVETGKEGNPMYKSVERILGKIVAFAKIAENNADKEVPKFYLIIDEINRANLAAVFGELIYGLEYRNSKVSTPYEVVDMVSKYSNKSGYTDKVPKTKDILIGKNIYIIGTMNTADRSIDSLDYALRRRFLFVDCPPEKNTIIDCCKNIMGTDEEDSIELFLFESIIQIFSNNEKHSFFNPEYSRADVMVGHTYFLRTSKEPDEYIKIMIERLIYQVIPILREYLKDGILEINKELQLKGVEDIEKETRDDRKESMAENVMIFTSKYGDEFDGMLIDNSFIYEYIVKLGTKLEYSGKEDVE